MEFDFVIVGAGIAGASIAYELARSARVCLLEGEARPGYHSTGRSAALFAPTYGGREIRALTRASRLFFESPPPGFGDRPLLLPRGCLYIARSEQMDKLRETTRTLRASGGLVTEVDARAARTYVPLLREGYVAGAALDADATDIEVHTLHHGFLRGARAAGATLLYDSWVRGAQRRDSMWSIDLAGGTVRAPVIVNAAGAWADEFATACGVSRIGLRALRRTALLVDAPEGVDVRNWPAVVDADEKFYFKPDAGRLLLSPADETPETPCDAQPDELDVAIGVDRVQAALDLEVRRVSHRWAGLRTFAPDRAPVVGYDPHVTGFFWSAGQGGYGIQTAPAWAKAAAALALNEPMPQDIVDQGVAAEQLSPHRYAGTSGSTGQVGRQHSP